MHVSRVACSGALLSRSVVDAVARDNPILVDASIAQAFRKLVHDARAARRAPARALADGFSRPLAALLGYEHISGRAAGRGPLVDAIGTRKQAVAALATLPFDEPLHPHRAHVLAMTAREGFRWCLLVNGRQLSLIDCTRAHARRWLTFELDACASDVRSLHALVTIGGAAALCPRAGEPSRVDELIARSDADLRTVRAALQAGVQTAALALTEALDRAQRRRHPGLDQLFEQSLTVVYRILFLQFAESRGLVPVWHPTYRHGYTVESLREMIQEQRDPRGAWEALQAISRLAHHGARAGDLSVVPFNGRLFSPAHAPVVASTSVPDSAAAIVVTALTSVEQRDGARTPIAYGDLGVEQLGSIYERVLECSPERDAASGAPLLRRGNTRKATGSFYTPRSLTEFIVKRTLEPLTRNASAAEILSLKIVDPAMGSGAFLVAACRELARAYEEALLREGAAGAGDWSPDERAGFRRLVAQRCLYGVDLNPMAVQLARLSLWLCSLAADKPLTFLDHRLRTGNSVLGGSPHDVLARAPGGRAGTPTLFGDDVMEVVGQAVEARRAIEEIPDDSVAQVRRKEAILATLDSDAGPLSPWRRICDLWCACWFWPDPGASPGPREFGAMCDVLRGSRALAPAALLERVKVAANVALSKRFFHWQLEFPEVFARGGFDAVIGNPPWDMVRGSRDLRQSLRFTRDSGTFRLQSSGHGNLYQLFAERVLQLARPGGRVGVVLPWGIATDHGSAGLRRHLLERCTMDELVVLDNRRAIFPIHRGVKFSVVFAWRGGESDAIRYKPAVCDPEDLHVPGDAEARAGGWVELSRPLLERISGDALSIPYVASAREVRVLERLATSAPAAADPRGWGVRFGRELNASDDRILFSETSDGYPVIAGRHIEPFRVNPSASSLRISVRDATERLGSAVTRFRLAYRDVAGAGNRVTLIAAIVPPRVATTHTLFCLRTRLDLDEQLFLCAVLNSYVANYLVRTRVGTHVTTALVHSLPIPRPRRRARSFEAIVSLARQGDSPDLQASVAALYGLDPVMFETILDSFPLVPTALRERAAAALAAAPAI